MGMWVRFSVIRIFAANASVTLLDVKKIRLILTIQLNYLLLGLFVLIVALCPACLADWLPALIASHWRSICSLSLLAVQNVTLVLSYTHATIRGRFHWLPRFSFQPNTLLGTSLCHLWNGRQPSAWRPRVVHRWQRPWHHTGRRSISCSYGEQNYPFVCRMGAHILRPSPE